MPGNIRVLVAEDDHFSSNWMALLLARDWRTRVAAQAASADDLRTCLANPVEKIDLVLLDTEMPGDVHWLGDMLQAIAERSESPKVLLLGTHPQEQKLRHVPAENLRGYILKSDICYALAWAATMAMQQRWVITPGVETMLHRARISILKPYLVLDGRVSFFDLTDHQTNVARLAFLFSMERRDLADELGLSQDWGYGLVSGIYKKLGLEELLNGEIDPQTYWGDHPAMLRHVREIISEVKQASGGGKAKARDLETLAFHLLTIPEIREEI